MTPACEEYHRVQAKQGAAIRALEVGMSEMKSELDQVVRQVTENGERQKFYIRAAETIQHQITELETKVAVVIADNHSLHRDMTETRETAHQIRSMVQTSHDLLNAHIGQETLQFAEYAKAAARSTATGERLNANLMRLFIALVLLEILLAMAMQKFDLVNKLLALLGVSV